MNEDNLIQTPAQDAVGDIDEPNVNPTPITHDVGEPSEPISEPDTKDPVMQFVVHNFDRMNVMYKAFTQTLKVAPQQQAFANAEPSIIEPWNSNLNDLHPGNVKENAFVESDNRFAPGGFFKDLIAKPPTTLEDLFTQTHNFIRAEDANNENRHREPHRETKQHMTYKDLPRRSKDKHVPRLTTRPVESHRLSRDNFTALIKSPAKILATSEGNNMLRPASQNYLSLLTRGIRQYCNFHEDRGHETNDCIDIRKEIKAFNKIVTMNEDNLIQTPAQDAVGDIDEPNVNPTPITRYVGGPIEPISKPDMEDPVMQFVVHNFDRMNVMYKAFTQKLKDAPQQQAFANAEPSIIEP
nr:hypothetical protein [Tanacetum cinerariifolium]